MNITKQSIGGIVGNKSKEEVAQAMHGSGSIEIPDPSYGYLRESQLERERADRNLKNDWDGGDSVGLIYVDRIGGNSSDIAFARKVKVFACRYRTKYTRGFGEKGEEWGSLAELQLGKVAARKGILEKQLEADDLTSGLKGEI